MKLRCRVNVILYPSVLLIMAALHVACRGLGADLTPTSSKIMPGASELVMDTATLVRVTTPTPADRLPTSPPLKPKHQSLVNSLQLNLRRFPHPSFLRI